jgi:putative chitinase
MNFMKDFQTANGLTPDGNVGKRTAEVLMKVLGITSSVNFAHFIAQCSHESGNFSKGRENLNYSSDALVKLFEKHFLGAASKNYARQPEKIANRLYADRMGNGNEVSGDGWKYRGTGPLQVTGKKNVQLYLKSVGLPLNTDPNVLLTGIHYFGTAKWFFDTNNIWKYCSHSDSSILTVSRIINLGSATSKGTPIGLAERITLTNKYFNL